MKNMETERNRDRKIQRAMEWGEEIQRNREKQRQRNN